MDPSATLARALELSREILRIHDSGRDAADALADLSLELAECVESLDKWLRSGGFLPARWARQPPRGPHHPSDE